jgi:pullulanase/glycogen debranching enzyme
MLDGGDIDGKENDEMIYCAFNSYFEDLTFELPYVLGKKWYRVVDTTDIENSFLEIPELITNRFYKVKARSCIVLIGK